MSNGRKKGNGHKKILEISCKDKKKLIFNYDGDQTLKQSA